MPPYLSDSWRVITVSDQVLGTFVASLSNPTLAVTLSFRKKFLKKKRVKGEAG
jgi:hypothetical protein